MPIPSAQSAHRLTNLVAVVTGGAGHIGSEICAQLARGGARVVVADIDGGAAINHAEALQAENLDAIGVEMDLESDESVSNAFDFVVKNFGGVDILVNNAAPSRLVASDAPAASLDLAIWDAVVSVMVRGALLCIQQAVPLMTRRGGGAIVNVSSVHGHAGDRDLTAYPVAKSALVGLTRSVATQYGADQIRCNAVTVGTIPFPSMSAEARQSRLRHQLLPYEGRPNDVAEVVAFLSSPASSFITGADVVADGGVLAHLPSYADGGTFDVMRGKS